MILRVHTDATQDEIRLYILFATWIPIAIINAIKNLLLRKTRQIFVIFFNNVVIDFLYFADRINVYH